MATDVTLFGAGAAGLAARRSDIEEKGLKATLAARQQDLADNKQSQADETASCGAENAEYRKTAANLVVAEETIEKALFVLTKFYDWQSRRLWGGVCWPTITTCHDAHHG
jgi:hypothetical protein